MGLFVAMSGIHKPPLPSVGSLLPEINHVYLVKMIFIVDKISIKMYAYVKYSFRNSNRVDQSNQAVIGRTGENVEGRKVDEAAPRSTKE
jgi:hypothetical protein